MAKKVKGFEDFNIEGEKEKLQKIKRSFKPNSDQQQFTTNTRNEFDETTRKITTVTKDEVDDKLKSLEENNLYGDDDFSDEFDEDLEIINDEFNIAQNALHLVKSVSEGRDDLNDVKQFVVYTLQKINDFRKERNI
jgi:hypothetical protein